MTRIRISAIAVAVGVAAVLGFVMSIGDPFTVVGYVAYAAVGWWLVARRPEHPIGWLLLLGFFGLRDRQSETASRVAAYIFVLATVGLAAAAQHRAKVERFGIGPELADVDVVQVQLGERAGPFRALARGVEHHRRIVHGDHG